MNESDAGFGVGGGEVIADVGECGEAGLARDGAGKQAGGFVDDEDVVVLVDDGERQWGARGIELLAEDLDFSAVGDRLIEASGGKAIDENTAGLEHALEGLAFGGGEFRF